MNPSTTVYCVFESAIDGDGYLSWDLIFVARTPERGRELILTLPIYEKYPDIKWDPVHPAMTKENNYSFVGTREEVTKQYDIEACNFPSDTKGYVIEAQSLHC